VIALYVEIDADAVARLPAAAELTFWAVVQALMGFHSEARCAAIRGAGAGP
jgi:hypothetical protein